jgi:hypothetical protein
MRRGLLVGINYIGTPNRLYGCINDINNIGSYLRTFRNYNSFIVMTDYTAMKPTRSNILAGFNALLKGFDGDEFTKFYIGWLQLNGFTESDFDDAAKFVKVGLSINVQELFTEHILIKNGNKQTLGDCAERIKANRNIGDRPGSHLIDQVHKAMFLYKGTNRGLLLKFIGEKADTPDNAFWRVVFYGRSQSLVFKSNIFQKLYLPFFSIMD